MTDSPLESDVGPRPPEVAVTDSRYLPSFELPTARQVVGRGFQLAYDSTRDIRRASLYIGLLLAAVVMPLVVLALADVTRLSNLSAADFVAGDGATGERSVLAAIGGPLIALGLFAGIGIVAVTIDGLLIVVGLLAGRAVGRPLRLREALARARQVFWRYVLASVLVTIVSSSVTATVLYATGSFSGSASLGSQLLASFVSTLVVAPFGYIATAIVIGDVAGMPALGRSVTLLRARPRLALAVAAFAFAASVLQTFGLGAAADIASRVGDALHLNLDVAGPGVILAGLIAFVALVALGSLLVTVNAVTAAPQVTAFLGLTRYAGGLDQAREPDSGHVATDPWQMHAIEATPTGDAPPLAADPWARAATPAATVVATPAGAVAPSTTEMGWAPRVRKPTRARWITIPMASLIALEVVVAGGGMVGAAGIGPISSDPMARLFEQIGWRGDATLSGTPQIVADAIGDQAPAAWKQADLTSAEYAVAPVVPPWVLDELVPCQFVFCVPEADPSAFDHGALFIMLDVAAPPSDLGPSDTGEWGPLLALPGTPVAPAGNTSYALSTEAYLMRLGPGEKGDLHRVVYENGDFHEQATSARAAWVGDVLITIVPMTELRDQPSGWDGLASVEGARELAPTRDWLRSSGAPLLPFTAAPTLTFHAEPGTSPGASS